MSNTKTSKTSKKLSNAVNHTQLSVRGAGVTFGTNVVLRGVSFEIKKGEFIGLVGQNGSGKTTLLRVMLGLLSPTRGQASKHQETIIGYVPQRGQLYNAIVPISVLEVASLGSEGDKQKAQKALKSVGMGRFERRSFSELSGGQQQRVVIAKALASGADVLILDEPMTGVDKSSQTEFYGLLKRLHQQGRTIIMVSHDIDSVMKLVSRVICLNRTVIYDGTPEGFDSEHHLRSHHNTHVHHEGHYV